MKKFIFIILVIILARCDNFSPKQNDLTNFELKQIGEIIDSIGLMNSLNLDYIVCNKFDFFATENFKFFNQEKNEDMTDINRKYFGKSSKQLVNLGRNTTSNNNFSITGVINGFVCISLVEGVENYNCDDSKTNSYKFYLVKMGLKNYEIIETNEVHFG